MRNLTTILLGVLLLPWMAYLSWPAITEIPAPRPTIVKVTRPQAPVSIDLHDAAYETQPKAPSQPSV